MSDKKQEVRPLYHIAAEIRKDWKIPNYGAIPYLRAMLSLNSIDDMYGMDNAKSIVNYFLANAQTWKGPKAREIKAELKAIVK